MTTLVPAYGFALGAIAYCQWVRRHTWRFTWEWTTTAASVCVGVGLMLSSPFTFETNSVGRFLFNLTGHWHLDDLLGYCFLLWGLGFACIAGMARMPDVRDRIVCRVQFPVRLAVIMMLVLFWNSHVAHDAAADMYQIHDSSYWFAAFWLVLYGAGSYLLAVISWVAFNLRHDPRSREVAYGWIVCCVVAAVGIVGFFLPWLHCAWPEWSRAFFCLAAGGWALVQAWAWRRKIEPYRRLVKGVGARL
jgi:hypothetical protein